MSKRTMPRAEFLVYSAARDIAGSRIIRVAKFLNRHAKKAKWLENHQSRAAVNSQRSADPRTNPTWHGIGHP